MTLYHMSDTLRLGDALTTDYKKQAGLAEPFTRALRRSGDCFLAMVLSGRYMREALGKFGMLDMWSDAVKWAAEGAFEHIRQTEYPHCVSRVGCNYFFDDLPDIVRLYEEDWGSAAEAERLAIRLYAIDLGDAVADRRDMRWFDRAYDALWDDDDLCAVLNCARSYFAGEGTENPVWELLSDYPGVAVQDLTSHLHP